jgi:hypothetical protein
VNRIQIKNLKTNIEYFWLSSESNILMAVLQIDGYLSDKQFYGNCQEIEDENLVEIYGEGSSFVAENYINWDLSCTIR